MGYGIIPPLRRCFAPLAIAGAVCALSFPLSAETTPTPTPGAPVWSPTPTPTLTPTPPWALKIFETSEVLALFGGSSTVSALHNGVVPEGTVKSAIGIWSREAGNPPGPWRFHGLAGFSPSEGGATVTSSLPWPSPESGVVYDLSARFRFNDVWTGDFFYGTWFDPEGPSPSPTPTPAPPPEIEGLFIDFSGSTPQIVVETNGFVSFPERENFVGLWYRGYQPRTPWTYMGLFPYSDGQAELAVDVPFELQIGSSYEFAARIRTRADGWVTPSNSIILDLPVPVPSRSYTAILRDQQFAAPQPIGLAPGGANRIPASRLWLRMSSLDFDQGKDLPEPGEGLYGVRVTHNQSYTLPSQPNSPLLVDGYWEVAHNLTPVSEIALAVNVTPDDFNFELLYGASFEIAFSPNGPWFEPFFSFVQDGIGAGNLVYGIIYLDEISPPPDVSTFYVAVVQGGVPVK